MMRHRSCHGLRHVRQRPSKAGMIVANVCVTMALALLLGNKAATFLGPARNGLAEQHVVRQPADLDAHYSSRASVRSAAANSFPQPTTVGGTRATDVFWAFSVFVVACGISRMAVPGSTSQRKRRSCTVACRAAEVPRPAMSQHRMTVEEDPMPTPATMVPPPAVAQIDEPRIAACHAKMVGGARCTCTTTTRSASRHTRQRKAADRAAASRAARRAIGSRLHAASCHQEVPPLTFDASRQRLKIQVGLELAKRMRSGHMREIRSPVGSFGKAGSLNGLFTTYFYMMGNLTYSKNLACATVRAVANFATRWPAPMHY